MASSENVTLENRTVPDFAEARQSSGRQSVATPHDQGGGYDIPRLTTPRQRRRSRSSIAPALQRYPSSVTTRVAPPVAAPSQGDESRSTQKVDTHHGAGQRGIALDPLADNEARNGGDDYWRWSEQGIVDISVEDEGEASSSVYATGLDVYTQLAGARRRIRAYRWVFKLAGVLCLWMLVVMASYYFMVSLPRHVDASASPDRSPGAQVAGWPAITLSSVQPWLTWQSADDGQPGERANPAKLSSQIELKRQ